LPELAVKLFCKRSFDLRFPPFRPQPKSYLRKWAVVRHWVVNASPIISLTKIDRIHLLSELCDDVVIPQGVADEINLGGYADNAVTWLQQAGQAFIKAAPGIDSRVASWDLGLGERQVLSWAISHTGYEAIIDDF